MRSANDPDIAAVYQLLTQVAQTVTGHDRKLDELSANMAELRRTVGGLGETVTGLSEIVARHDRKLDDLAAGLGLLREAVTNYHATVLGHGIDQRTRRAGAPYRAAFESRPGEPLSLTSAQGRAGWHGGRGR
jgi:uncharacterized coiled-coil protein SlyX